MNTTDARLKQIRNKFRFIGPLQIVFGVYILFQGFWLLQYSIFYAVIAFAFGSTLIFIGYQVPRTLDKRFKKH